MNRFFLPLVLLLGIGALFWYGLALNPALVPSPLIGKPAPAFELPLLDDPESTFSHLDLQGRVTMVHVWATWCVTCRAEHPTLMAFARRGMLPIIGLNWKDERSLAVQWVQRLGNPYERTLFDGSGHVGIDWGVYGTPETFIIDRHGIIRFKHVGPLSDDLIESHIVPLVTLLQEDGA